MNRSPNRRSHPAIHRASRLLPPTLSRLASMPDYLLGVSPTFVDLHRYSGTEDGRSYASTAHVAWLEHQRHLSRDRRRTTVVLPRPERPSIIIHELGHVLHEYLWTHPTAPPGKVWVPDVTVSAYAATNVYERFAEAFVCWVMPHARPQGYETLMREDPATIRLFDSLRLSTR